MARRESRLPCDPREHLLAEDAGTCESTGKKVTIAYRDVGPVDGDAVVMIPGLNSNMEMYPMGLVQALVARGLRVVYMDNRDTGFSTKFDDRPVSSVASFFLPRSWKLVTAPYRLEDMADDVAHLMDAIGLRRATVLGISMGGMIAQVFAIRHPARTAALVSITSTTHGPNLPDPPMSTKLGFLKAPKDKSIDALVELKTWWYEKFGTTPEHGPRDDFRSYFHETSHRMVSRSTYDGFQRQMAAIVTGWSRDEALGSVTVPALVIAGARDCVVLPAHGFRTAACLPNAALHVLPDMGHCVDPLHQDHVCDLIARMARRASYAPT